jgi:hypothetical protein
MDDLVTKVPLYIENLAGETRILIINGVFPYYSYNEDGSRSNTQLGFIYSVVSPSLGYAKFNVKVPGGKKTPTVTMEEIKAHNAPLYCRFTGFQAKFYRNGTAIYLTATADSIEIVEVEAELEI